ATGIRNRVQSSFPGRVQFVDNLGDTLSTAAGDALYAETLYIMLAVPGALVALPLAYLAALGTGERDRAGLALLPAPGASRPRPRLDVLALAVSGLVYRLTARTGFSAVVNPDSNPTLSLSVYMFLAPSLLWLGATLLLVRARGRAVTWIARRVAGERARTTPGFLLASAGRRGAAINRGLVVTSLLLASGVTLGIFTATYDQQTRVEAQLTLGADVVLDAPPGVVAKDRLVSRGEKVPGASGTTALDHSYAYVGPDLQDTFGIYPGTLTRAATWPDSYCACGSPSGILSRLR